MVSTLLSHLWKAFGSLFSDLLIAKLHACGFGNKYKSFKCKPFKFKIAIWLTKKQREKVNNPEITIKKWYIKFLKTRMSDQNCIWIYWRLSIRTDIFQNIYVGWLLPYNTLATRRWQECTIYLSITTRYGEREGCNFSQVIQ